MFFEEGSYSPCISLSFFFLLFKRVFNVLCQGKFNLIPFLKIATGWRISTVHLSVYLSSTLNSYCAEYIPCGQLIFLFFFFFFLNLSNFYSPLDLCQQVYGWQFMLTCVQILKVVTIMIFTFKCFPHLRCWSFTNIISNSPNLPPDGN